MPTLSAAIITLNEAHRIRRCLDSLSFCDEIVVVDSGSTDATLDIAREYTDRVFTRPWTTYADQKNFAAQQTTGEWVFSIDADEWVTPELAENIRAAIADPQAPAVMAVERRTQFLGHWMDRCWSGDWVTRVFRRGVGEFRMGGAHESFVTEPPVRPLRLRGALCHVTDTSLEQYFDKLNDYSTRGAESVPERKAKRFGNMFRHGAAAFFKMYIVKRGFLDGRHGLLLSLLSGLSAFVKYAKAWHHQQATEAATDD